MFGIPKLSLLVRRDQLYQVLLLNIAQEKLWLNKVVARIEVTVTFQCQGIATRLREDTQRRGQPHPQKFLAPVFSFIGTSEVLLLLAISRALEKDE